MCVCDPLKEHVVANSALDVVKVNGRDARYTRYTLLSLLIFRTHARSVKREGCNLTKKKKRKYCGCCIPLRLCLSIARYSDF